MPANSELNITFSIYLDSTGGNAIWIETQNVSATKGVYQGTIPASQITERGVEYYITAEDVSFNVSTSPVDDAQASPHVILVSYSSLDCLYSTPDLSYRMISVPGNLDNKSISSVM